MEYTQENRLIAIDTPLGKDVLLLAGFSGKEGISLPFQFELEMLSLDNNIVFEDIIGKSVTVSILLADGSQRFINGIISSFRQTRGSGGSGKDLLLAHYTATMVPWVWLLSRTTDSRIFQSLSIPEIVEQVFQEKKFPDFEFILHDTYEKKEYCVQYQETDLNFVSRLLEQEGLYYFFRHEEKKHILIISDSPEDNKPCPKQEEAHCQASAGGLEKEDVITNLERTREIRYSKYVSTDYYFQKPDTDLKVEVDSKIPLGPPKREIYEYPGNYEKRTDGDRLVNIRMQAQEAAITTIAGASRCRAFATGYRFILHDHYREDMNKKAYVLTGITHSAQETYEVSGGKKGEATYTNAFTCIPHEVPFRPQRATPKPVIAGAQTAIVTGPAGEEIHTDEFGRVKVQFHWDRVGKKDDKTSCWIRVAQVWAGLRWGALYMPRIGHEVIVEFLEGDPDRPIITGRVYHGTNMPPYTLPDEKTKSTLKSTSSPGGDGFNEIRFEDKKGEEQIFMHGERNLDIRTKANMYETVGHDSNVVVKNDRFLQVENNLNETITGNRVEDVAGDLNSTVGGKESRKVGDKLSITVSGDVAETFGGDHSEITTGDIFLKGKNVVIEAGTNLTLKVGTSHIAIEAGGITIKTTGTLELEGTTKVDVKGGVINANATGMAEIKGPLVKIN
ncbi:MAG: type VI secretion system Vgr family protein [Desulfomonilia bacterium]